MGGDHRSCRADPGHAIGPDRARPDARPARGLSSCAACGPSSCVATRSAEARSASPSFSVRTLGGTRVVSGLADDPGHDRAARQMEDFGSIVSFDIAGGLGGQPVRRGAHAFAIAAASVDGIAGSRAGNAAAARPDARAAALVGDRARDGTALGRNRGSRRSHCRSGAGPGPQPGLIDPRSALSCRRRVMLRGADGGRKRAIGRRLGCSADG